MAYGIILLLALLFSYFNSNVYTEYNNTEQCSNRVFVLDGCKFRLLMAFCMLHAEEELTPLIVASLRGHHAVVRLLVTKFHADVKQTGTVRFDHCLIERANALWCAAGHGHLEVVQELIKAGADVNQAYE